MKRTLFLLLLTIIFSGIAMADIRLPDTPKPKSSKSIDATLMIKLDDQAKEARLIIPKDQLKQLRAELEQLDNGDNSTGAAVNTGLTRTQTIVSGTFMSLGLLFGGVWFARSRKISTKVGKATIAGAILFLVASVATVSFANIGPPIETRSITGKIFTPAVHHYNQASGKIKVEIVDGGDFQLIVPNDQKNEPGVY